jgi:predicted RNase H-related nuclease YkuK (DUF458 family)
VYNRMNIESVKDFIMNQSPETKIYIGGDSERIMINDVWYADYTLAVVVHIDGKHGCKIFGDVQRERDYEKNKNKPRMRLMTEVYKISELYLQLADVLEEREVEIHLDINPDERYGSSCVVQEAIGYIRGMCNVIPMVKPRAFAASYCADRLKEIMNMQQNKLAA